MSELKDIKLYNIKETAELLGVTPRTIQTYLKEGRIKGRKIGGSWRFTEQSINEFINGSDEFKVTSDQEIQRLLKRKEMLTADYQEYITDLNGLIAREQPTSDNYEYLLNELAETKAKLKALETSYNAVIERLGINEG